jgi:hypothetical protein
LLEQLAPETDKAEGYDIADYLTKQDWRLFRDESKKNQPTHEPKLGSQLQKLIKKHPMVKELIERMELVEVN